MHILRIVSFILVNILTMERNLFRTRLDFKYYVSVHNYIIYFVYIFILFSIYKYLTYFSCSTSVDIILPESEMCLEYSLTFSI